MKSVYTIEDLRHWIRVTSDCQPPLRFAVIGDPIAHSASPQMHNAALEACGIAARYTRLHIKPDEVAECLSLLKPAGFLGINCTIPHKGTVLELINQRDPSAIRAGGVNTVRVEPDGSLTGFSTDGEGLSRAVQECFGVTLDSQRVLILGAGGGAGRAVAMQCAHQGCLQLTLANRTMEKLQPLVEALEKHTTMKNIATIGMEEHALSKACREAQLIINCTAVGMKQDDPSPLPSSVLRAEHLIYDTIYTAHQTPLMLAAEAAGARSANGLAMLLHQGAKAFELWLGKSAPIDLMRNALLETKK
jgi:shikimate dehydrogenase